MAWHSKIRKNGSCWWIIWLTVNSDDTQDQTDDHRDDDSKDADANDPFTGYQWTCSSTSFPSVHSLQRIEEELVSNLPVVRMWIVAYWLKEKNWGDGLCMIWKHCHRHSVSSDRIWHNVTVLSSERYWDHLCPQDATPTKFKDPYSPLVPFVLLGGFSPSWSK